MRHRLPQPPIDPLRRSTEARGFLTGACITAAGLVLVILGANRVTSAETTEGARARETELVRAFAYGGIRYTEPGPPAPPIPTGDPGMDAAAMDRWERQVAEAVSSSRKLRVDTGAKAACPT